MLPSVSPLTSSPKKRLQSTGGNKIAQTRTAHRGGGPYAVQLRSAGLRDSDENSLDRVVDAEWLLHHVAVLVEAERKAQQRRRGGDVRLLDLRTNLGARGRAVLAGPVDRPRDDLSRHVARGAEELGLASVELLEGL